jgi:hypothetical protein
MRSHVVRERTPISGEMGGTRETRTTYETRPDSANRRNNRSVRSAGEFNPARMGSKASGRIESVGLLAAEFLAAISLLILLMFSDTQSSFASKMMSIMKRGTLTCLLFFILALIAGIGPSAAKIAKAFGALIVVAILVTSPVSTVLTDLDSIIKNDWIGSGESADDATGNQTNPTPSAGGNTVTLTKSEISKLVGAAIGSPAYNAFTAELRAWKSGEVWKVPADAITSLEDTGVHGISKLIDFLKNLL